MLVVPRWSHVTPGPARIPVVVVGGVDLAQNGLVGLELGLSAVCRLLQPQD